MSYLHIDNLYKDTTILLFKECYAMEKIHGTSAHIRWKSDEKKVILFSGGAKFSEFEKLFDKKAFQKKIEDIGWTDSDVTFYGEAYGGKMQGMSKTYGKELKFVVFDVFKDNVWLNVPNASNVAHSFGFDFVAFERVSTNIESLDAERDRPSRQAKKNGILEDLPAEGVVLRPIEEFTMNNGKRVICKHKRAEFMETAHEKKVDPEKRIVMAKAKEIADEWVVPMRLNHVLDKIGNPTDIKDIPKVISAMVEDVKREAEGFIVWNKETEKAISQKTAIMFKKHLENRIHENFG
jgi:hypothetical protein